MDGKIEELTGASEANQENQQSSSSSSAKIDNHDQREIRQLFASLIESNDENESKMFEFLNGLSEDDLLLQLKEINEINAALLKEIGVYEFTIKEDEVLQNIINAYEAEMQSQPLVERLVLLSYPLKCCFARNKMKKMQKTFAHTESAFECDLQEFKFKLESLLHFLEDLKESRGNFNRNVRFGGRHPVTKKVILQKVAKYFDDSIKSKMAMTNRYKIQIQSNIMEHHKLQCQIREQEKRLASLDLLKYQEAKIEHEKSCDSLIRHKDQLAKCKSRFNTLYQSVSETKRNLEKESVIMEEVNAAVSKKEYTKDVMRSEKIRNDQKVKELNAAMHAIKLDPRRHDLPEVLEYAKLKKENFILKQNIAMWKKKVELVEQAKRLHLDALRKKTHDM